MSELAIDDIHFDDFSLDVDAMITAALRMFMELGMVQKFKIDYEGRVRSWGSQECTQEQRGSHFEPWVSQMFIGDDHAFPAYLVGLPWESCEMFVEGPQC